MAWTQTQLDALDDAIATGARTVTVDGKTVTYGSVSEMLRLRKVMNREINGAGTASNIRRVEFGRAGSGSQQ